MDYTKYPGKKLKKYGEFTNEEKPQITIITPYYNAGKYIEETFNSVMNQTYPYFEWIIVDDGSKDKESVKKLEEIAKRDKRIKTYRIDNGGPSIARDFAISKASSSTKYIYPLDSDDVLNPTIIECLYWSLETHPKASFAYATIVNFGHQEFLWEKYLTIEQEKVENLINGNSMVRKEDILEVGCYGIKEKAMFEDWNLWLKLIRAGKVPLRVSAPLFWYRKLETSELSRASKNKKGAMKYVNETASTIPDDIVEPIQFPRYGDKYATVKDYNLVLPDYKKDPRKTILFLVPWMVVGGADYFNLEIVKRLPSDEYRFIIITTIPGTNPLRQEFEEYAEVYDLSSFLDRIDYQSFTDYIISSRKVDLVFMSNSDYGYYMTPFLKSKHPTIPFIDYIHSVDMSDPRGAFGRYTMDFDKYLYKTYVCNGFTKKQLKENFNKESEVVYIGTSSEKFDKSKYNKEELLEKYKIPNNKKIITFIARIAPEKRPEMFIEIAKRIHSKRPDTFFVIAGDGPLMNVVKQKADKNFKLLGMVDKSEEIYAISDITINCSTLEGLALTSYESLSMGVPVVSADVGGQKELIDDKVGAIVHYNENATKEVYNSEIDEYVDKVLKILNNYELISKNCRQRILNGFTLDLMAKNMQKIFDEAIPKCKNDKVEKVDNTIYQLGCETLNWLYFCYTNNYYETHLGIWLTAPPVPFPRQYRRIMNFLHRIGAYKEGKIIKNFISNFIKFIKQLLITLKYFILSIPCFILFILKCIKRIITKPFR